LSEPDEAGAAPDQELVRLAQQGELAAFEELVRRNQQPLFNYLFRMCGNRADAEELTQAALVRSWQALAGFRGASSFKTWLFRIGMNLCYNQRQRRRPTEELDEQQPAAVSEEPTERFAQRERERVVRAALAGLPADQRSALVLSVYEQLSYREIGAAMGRSVRAVDSLLVRAKANLRRALEPARRQGVV
jgi:RNA polymerase sigma-70 factor (ECF subfamily)